nr:RIP metalloprotease RseP [Aceticella autotrophica]
MIYLIIVLSLIVLSILVMVHEFGHFIVAKMSGTKVNEFSIGFGPRLFKWKYGETEYSFRILLLGGYCALAGEDEKTDDKRGFANKPWYIRLAILAAGPIMNILLAMVFLFMAFYITGSPVPQVKSVLSGYPAQKAGILPNDKIVMINGTKINDWNDLERIISSNKGTELNLKIKRDNSIIDKKITPITDKKTSKAMIGIMPEYQRSIFLAIKTAVDKTIYFSKIIILSIVLLITGKVSTNDLMGPVGIVQTIGVVAKTGFVDLLIFSAFISVNLGLFNLLPFPALDGGRILFVIIEVLRGKPVDPNKEGFVHYIGFLLLIILFIFVTYRDLVRIFLIR